MNDLSLQETTEKAVRWANSREGQAALMDAMEKSRQTIEMLQEARKLTWEQLNTPMSI